MTELKIGHLQAKDFADLAKGVLNVEKIAEAARLQLKGVPVLVVLYKDGIRQEFMKVASDVMYRKQLYICALRIDDDSEKDLLAALPRMLVGYNVLNPKIRKLLLDDSTPLSFALQFVLPMFLLYRPDGTFLSAHKDYPELSSNDYYKFLRIWSDEGKGL